MAVVRSPLFSLDARGQIGKALVYMVWKGLQTVRKYAIPANPRTASQLVIRGYFTDAVDAYQSESDATKLAWDNYAKILGRPMSGFNAYISKFIKYCLENAGTPPELPFLPPS